MIQAKNSWANLGSFWVFARSTKTILWVLVCIVCVFTYRLLLNGPTAVCLSACLSVCLSSCLSVCLWVKKVEMFTFFESDLMNYVKYLFQINQWRIKRKERLILKRHFPDSFSHSFSNQTADSKTGDKKKMK